MRKPRRRKTNMVNRNQKRLPRDSVSRGGTGRINLRLPGQRVVEPYTRRHKEPFQGQRSKKGLEYSRTWECAVGTQACEVYTTHFTSLVEF